MLKKKIWANFQRITELFTQKIVTKHTKIWVWDPGSEIRKKPIPDSGSRDQKGTGSRIRIRNTAKYLLSLSIQCYGSVPGTKKSRSEIWMEKSRSPYRKI
jgi:hypothetical protein